MFLKQGSRKGLYHVNIVCQALLSHEVIEKQAEGSVSRRTTHLALCDASSEGSCSWSFPFILLSTSGLPFSGELPLRHGYIY